MNANDASIEDYIEFHTNKDTKIYVYSLPTTLSQEKIIKNKAIEYGGAGPFYCADHVSYAIEGICGIKGSFSPGILYENAKKSSCGE